MFFNALQGGCMVYHNGAHLFLKAPTTTLGPEGRCPSPFYTTLCRQADTTCGEAAPLFYT